VRQDVQFDNGFVNFIDGVLRPPPRVREFFPMLQNLLYSDGDSQIQIIDRRTTNGMAMLGALQSADLLDELESIRDITLLVPKAEAFYDIGSIFDGMTQQELREILGYHIVVGSVIITASLDWEAPANLNWTSIFTTLSGKELKMTMLSLERELQFRSSTAFASQDFLIYNGNMIVIKS
jgi:uncharacterized surface protein with fasciclin (FAS1) repeats